MTVLTAPATASNTALRTVCPRCKAKRLVGLERAWLWGRRRRVFQRAAHFKQGVMTAPSPKSFLRMVSEASMSILNIRAADPAPKSGEPDFLTEARAATPNVLAVRFADGRGGRVDLRRLGLNVRELRMTTAKASSWGSAAEILDCRGHTVHVDASVLRAQIDPNFASELARAIAQVQAGR